MDSCEIKICVLSRGLEGCWQCHEVEGCGKLEFLRPFHGNGPKENLKKIARYGLEGWALHREKCYPWTPA